MDSDDNTRPSTDPYLMQIENDLSFPAADATFHDDSIDPYIMPDNNHVWNPQNDVSFSDILTNMSMVPAQFQCAPTYPISNCMANEFYFSGYCDSNISGGSMAADQIQALLNTPFQTVNNNTESHTIPAEIGQEESEYTTHATGPNVPTRTRISPEEWLKWKPEIQKLYVHENYSLEETRAKMSQKGFPAKASMYKRKIREWGWRTYGLDKKSGNSDGKLSIRQPRKRTRGKAPSDPSKFHEAISESESSHSTTVASCAPPPLAHNQPQSAYSDYTPVNNTHGTSSNFYPSQSNYAPVNKNDLLESTWQLSTSGGTGVPIFAPSGLTYAYLSTGIPAAMSNTKFDGLMNTILVNVKDLYIRYPAQKKWKVEKQRAVEEDMYGDLMTTVVASLHNYCSISPTVGYAYFQNVLHMLQRVVGAGEGRDCGLFSLPRIWASFLRMVRDKRLDWARKFLSRALVCAMHQFGRQHPLVQVLFNLEAIWMDEPGQLEEVVCTAFRRCIADVKEQLGTLSLTHLYLQVDYLHMFRESTDEAQAIVNNIRSMIEISDEEKGPGEGMRGVYTLDLFNLMLYALDSSPVMADEAEKVAKQLLFRMNRRRMRDELEFNGQWLTARKEVMYNLSVFCYRRKDYHQAIYYLEDVHNHAIVDEMDFFVVQTLEGCYGSLGRDEDAKELWQQRMDHAQKLLQWHETRNKTRGRDEDYGDTIEEERSEATVVDMIEEINEESFEEDIANESGDLEVEIQLVQDQMAELQQRLKVLKGARGKAGSL